ncbi:MAG: LysR family transcriptional regulator [Alphaproteobacteria bacterium]|nr:LysR family transcriptional regulator [Alphaproteobacteria bacterium]
MDSAALDTFVAIHRAGGFSGAAKLLNRSQPAISRRIALLEQELGAPLFERAAGGVVLSQAGRELMPHAERVLAALQDAGDAVRALRPHPAGRLSVAAVGTLASAELTNVLKRFVKSYPAVKLSLRTATSAEVSGIVRRGETTIGLRYFDDPSPDLSCRMLKPEKLVVACCCGHGLAGKKVRRLRDLRAEHWFAFPDAHAWRDASAVNILAQFLVRDVGEIDWTPVDSLTAQKRLIEAGFGLALLPERSLREELARKSLAVIGVGDLTAANPVVAITRKDGYLSAAARKMLDLLAAEF